MLDVSFVMSCCWLTVSLWVAKLITLRSVTDLFTFYYYMMKQMHQVQKVSEPQTTSDLITAVSYRVCLLSVIYYFKQISMWYAAIRFCNNINRNKFACNILFSIYQLQRELATNMFGINHIIYFYKVSKLELSGRYFHQLSAEYLRVAMASCWTVLTTCHPCCASPWTVHCRQLLGCHSQTSAEQTCCSELLQCHW